MRGEWEPESELAAVNTGATVNGDEEENRVLI